MEKTLQEIFSTEPSSSISISSTDKKTIVKDDSQQSQPVSPAKLSINPDAQPKLPTVPLVGFPSVATVAALTTEKLTEAIKKTGSNLYSILEPALSATLDEIKRRTSSSSPDKNFELGVRKPLTDVPKMITNPGTQPPLLKSSKPPKVPPRMLTISTSDE
jgi:hypothetical protein